MEPLPNRLIALAKTFLRRRWETLRSDGYLQAFLAGLVLSLPLLYWEQYLFRAGLLFGWAGFLILIRLVRRDLAEIRRLGSEIQLADPDLPRHLIFFHLQLRNRFVSGIVFQFRLFLAVNICLLHLNNPLCLLLVDPLLGFLLWFPLAASEELYLLRRHGPSAGPVGSRAGAGFRTAAEQVLNHMQQNPKFYGVALTVGSGFGYMAKSYWDGTVQKDVNLAASNQDVIANGRKLEQQFEFTRQTEQLRQQTYEIQCQSDINRERELSRIRTDEVDRLSRIQTDEVDRLSRIQTDEVDRLSRIRTEEDDRRTANQLRVLQATKELSAAPGSGKQPVRPPSSLPDEPDLSPLPMRPARSTPLLDTLYRTAITYPAPANLTYLWNFGVYALLCLAIQIATGLFLAMHYVPDQTLAFASVEHIMRDVNAGWLLRYIHANGASMFFIVVYVHTFRGLYYGSYVHPRQHLWGVGVVILLLMIVTAFLGYVLPWGQMSFWAATVITNLLSALPRIGQPLVVWVWGGYSVDNATLNRFFSLHFFLPFAIAALVGLHLVLLHTHHSNNPLGIDLGRDSIPFYPYYIVKDLYGVVLFLLFFAGFLFFAPNLLGHPDNYIPANPMVTPPHIVPEWYFLPFYAILRAIPDKLLGVLALGAAVGSLLLLPQVVRPEVRSSSFRPLSHLLFWLILLDGLVLGWVGSKPVEHPYVIIGQVATALYFAYFFLLLPGAVWLERFFWTNSSYLSVRPRS